MELNGVLLLDKPEGPSSAQLLGGVKKKLGLRKVGHCGTLDPFASGLLVCLTGRATRLAAFAQGGRKSYSGVIRLGLVTSSDDITGGQIAYCATLPDFTEVTEAAKRFVGRLSQVPPQVSAVKVAGERAYSRARQGLSTELAPRSVEIFSFELRALNPRQVSFQVSCSSGTYIRSLARDLGASLGCGGCLEQLRRCSSAPFTVEQAKQLVDLTVTDILPWQTLFPEANVIELSDARLRKVSVGLQVEIKALAKECQDRYLGSDKIIVRRVAGDPEGLFWRQEDHWRFVTLVN